MMIRYIEIKDRKLQNFLNLLESFSNKKLYEEEQSNRKKFFFPWIIF